MRRIKQNDEVVVISGRDRGKRGKVLKVLKDNRALISGVHMIKKHQKPNPNKNEPGGITNKAMPIHVSNLAIINPDTGEKDKVTIKIKEDGKKVRVFRSSGNEIPAVTSKK